MRISDDERREAVDFLRSGKCLYFVEHRKTELDCSRCMKVSTMLFGHYDALCDLDSCGTDTWQRLADLIDRPTCLDLVEHKQDPFIPGKRMVDGYFHCSDCRWDGQIWEHIGFGDMLAYEAVHCPKCGAIIERRA